ncbi:MAG: type I-D CRISPR-associated protein Cas5/Csc1 [Bacteroidota bacterium]
MRTTVLKLTLLNHLFYYTEVSGGSTSSSITGDFLGDLALNYALNKALTSNPSYYRYLKKPEYQEIGEFGFYCTVARPMQKSNRTEAYIQGTSFNTDGIFAITPPSLSGSLYQKAAKSPYKTYRQVQGMKIGSSYQALLLSKTKLSLPPVVRVGRALESLVQIEEVELNAKMKDEFWLNAFSLKVIFDNLDLATKILVREKKVNFSYILENYNLIKQLSLKNVQEIFQPIFAHG